MQPLSEDLRVILDARRIADYISYSRVSNNHVVHNKRVGSEKQILPARFSIYSYVQCLSIRTDFLAIYEVK